MASDVEIYKRHAREKGQVPALEFELKNIAPIRARAMGGGNRDPFGREERVQSPFYFTDTVLREGLSEYSYNMGFSENFGAESNDYGARPFRSSPVGITNSRQPGLGEGGRHIRRGPAPVLY